ncbi:MAG: YggT family protein [Clostridiales bacterium]|nr:YggT family protein [Clostridiales bacterium]
MDEVVIEKTGQGNLKARKIVYYISAILETLLAFRLVLKLLGANPQSIFVSIIYSVTKVFLFPFVGIFRSAVTEGIETQSVLEPSTIIAMIVYALVAWGIVRLIEINKVSRNTVRNTVIRRIE